MNKHEYIFEPYEVMPWKVPNVDNVQDLIFLGRRNLEAIAEYWSHRAHKTSNIADYGTMCGKEAYAKKLSEHAEDKPLFNHLRDDFYFRYGTSVRYRPGIFGDAPYIQFRLEEYEKGTVINGYRAYDGCVTVINSSAWRFSSEEIKKPKVYEVSSPYILTPEEYTYFNAHWTYWQLWLTAADRFKTQLNQTVLSSSMRRRAT